MDSQVLQCRARKLVQRLASGCEDNSLGSATVTVYDTAWVSMITKPQPVENDQWLFPESFQFLLESQLPCGGWESYGSYDDGILNTLAALIAIIKHSRAGFHDFEERIPKAIAYLTESLQHWDVDASMQVGFEILIPALLEMLESEGIRFIFPGRELLERLHATKLAKFDPEVLYSSSTTTLLHSLEAFASRIDFDRLSHHTTFGSMMASPAATAAYLIYSPTWDIEAETYLRRVVQQGEGKGTGSVPSVFPIPIFEVTWILSTLLENGFAIETLGEDPIDRLAAYLEKHLRNQHGLLGFAPSVLPDADDTAKALYTLNLLGRAATPDRMIENFLSEKGNFRTYLSERDSSFSANCNTLMALLHAPQVEDFSAYIMSTTTFLCDSWWDGKIKDKWNRSLQYSMMLLAKTLTRLLHLWDDGSLQTLPDLLLRDRVPVVMTQILTQTLLKQNASGAWGPDDSVETTAYSILTLKAVCSLPWHVLLLDETISAIESGQRFLNQSQDKWTSLTYHWIEKVTYGSARLSESYCLAAMKASIPLKPWCGRVQCMIDVPEKPVLELARFLTTLHDFLAEPVWKIRASVIEGFVFLPQLKSARMDIMPGQKEAKNDYIAYIPFTWTVVNNHYKLFLRTNLLWDMMVLTMCNFRVDEFMETEVAKLSKGDLQSVKSMFIGFCNDKNPDELPSRGEFLEDSTCPTSAGFDRAVTETHETHSNSILVNVREVIGHYTSVMLTYPSIIAASTADQVHFRSGLRDFLLSHVDQIMDNKRFATQPCWSASTISIFRSPRTSFYNWAHTTGADSVSCPFSFAFFVCLLGAAYTQARQSSMMEPVADCFGGVYHKYLAQDLCAHLAVMSRLYNDFGSMKRDRMEANINSTDFPEFHHQADIPVGADEEEAIAGQDKRLKHELLELAQHERECAEMAMVKLVRALEDEVRWSGREREKEKRDSVKLFVRVAMLYADIYVARDLSNRVGGER